MAIKNKQDLRVIKTKESIYTAFKQMICEMDADKITIRELTNRARIHYKTFYLHYTCIEDLFEDVIRQLLEEYFQEIDKLPVDVPFTVTNRVFFNFMAKQESYIEKLILAPSYRKFANRAFMAMLTHNRERYNPYGEYSLAEQHIINNYLCTTSMSLYQQWIEDGKEIPLEEIIELSGKLLNGGITSLS